MAGGEGNPQRFTDTTGIQREIDRAVAGHDWNMPPVRPMSADEEFLAELAVGTCPYRIPSEREQARNLERVNQLAAYFGEVAAKNSALHKAPRPDEVSTSHIFIV